MSKKEPTIPDELREAVRDGLSNHSGEFANPWIFKGGYSHELLADILNDIMASERLFKNLTKLISKREIEARRSTLQSLMLKYVDIMRENRNLSSKEVDEKVMDYVADRLKELRTTK